MKFKNIHIGQLIEKKVIESNIEIHRLCNSFNLKEPKIRKMYEQESIDSEILLKWCKILDYDFFRIYTQHLILYAPSSATQQIKEKAIQTSLPEFRKNIYTREIIDFIIEQVSTGEMSKSQIIQRYKIPKTTLYKWISKYRINGY